MSVVSVGLIDTRDRGIMPLPFSGCRTMVPADLPLVMTGPATSLLGQCDLTACLPSLMETRLETGILANIPPIIIPSVLLGGGKPRLDRTAPPGLRLFLEFLMFPSVLDRQTASRFYVERQQLMLLLRGRSPYQPGRDHQALNDALLVAHNCRVRSRNDDGLWAPVRILHIPDGGSSSEVVVEVELPDGSERGPRIHRPYMRFLGATSGFAWRLMLSLAYLWDKFLRGAAAPGLKSLPWMDNDDLLRCCMVDSTILPRCRPRERLMRRVRSAVELITAWGVARRQTMDGRTRLLPPDDWYGWKGGGSLASAEPPLPMLST